MKSLFVPGNGVGDLDARRTHGDRLVQASKLIRSAMHFDDAPEGVEVWEAVCNRLTELGVAINAVAGIR